MSQTVISSTGYEGVIYLFISTTQASLLMRKAQITNLLIFPDVQKSINKILSNVVQVAVCVFGVFSNIINILVFYKIGFADSVTVVLFGLAISDLGYLFFSVASQTLDILDAAVGLHPFEPLKNLAFQVLWFNNMFYDITIILTVFNAVQKCACVAIPLIFKSVFTKSRSIFIVGFVYVGIFIYYIPTFANPGTASYFDPSLNWTRLGNYYLPNNETVNTIFYILSRILLPFVSQAVIIFCMVILTVKLRATLKFRRTLSLHQGFAEENENERERNKAKGSGKELRAIQTVTLVSAIFVVCNSPDILITLTRSVYPEFSDTSSRFESTYRMCGAIQDVFAVTNSAVNIVVYLKYNNKYRRRFKEIIQAVVRPQTRLRL
ncbi:unnamed protein product [Candidula unifasciata]|uniref:G-protein coupled receptors family 1 profile domain-containing protein n=1 Tax=Candidula unifasciata TaxID=100452 RepID=A0A8S3YXL0_9EUPU|nr:unnamed protein product [Candidula unifasciata]